MNQIKIKICQGNNNMGFSFLEVVMAMLVFTIGILAIGGLHISSIKGNDTARRVSEASTIMMEQLETLIAMPYTHADLSDTMTSGTSHERTVEGYNIRWSIEDNIPVVKTKTVHITVQWNDRGTSRSISMSHIIAGIP